MFIEDQEKADWNIDPNMDNITRKLKSIQAYWLDKWYDKMKTVTFETVMYDSLDAIPDILPFDKCMVRYENKSPKDSDHWGPCCTKVHLVNMFYTSLRCKTNPGKIYCVRKWTELTNEYRCFWNGQLVAISSELETEPPIDQIMAYIKKISSLICYNKCVFDIAHLADTNELIFVEYNSWESNSGAHRFDWLTDTEVLYDTDYITVRWIGGEKQIPLVEPKLQNQTKITNFDNYVVANPRYPTNWLVTDKHIYLANDIWLGRFTLIMKPINWVRGVCRFNCLQLCEDGSIYAEPIFYYYDLTPKKSKSKVILKEKNNDTTMYNFKYGFQAINKDGVLTTFRILSNCDIVLVIYNN